MICKMYKFSDFLQSGYRDMAQNRKESNDDLEVKVFGQGHCCSEFKYIFDIPYSKIYKYAILLRIYSNMTTSNLEL